ncbi:MAG: DNA replication and repair protein RecF, partial [Clostridiales bacterium]|nr:DNA replication and repair protein RecF [Clostridiales bacterium]
MWVRGLTLSSFRNFKYLQTALASGVNIIHGDNAQGKTNFLEALFYCATGRSSRAANERELISFGCETAYLRAEMEREGSSRTIDVGIRNDGARTYKSLAVDRVPIRRTVDLYGLLLVVMFSPEDLRLVKAGPAERRAFMDMEICQLSPVYCHDLKQYHHALKQRNALLKELQKGEGSPL